jgi:diguanylate cyclase (GGDEF)-like protein
MFLASLVYAIKEKSIQQDKLAYSESKILAAYSFTHRDYYQDLYLNKIIPLDINTIRGLPAFSSSLISEIFSNNNELGVSIATVSDNPRNENNRANAHEMEAIEAMKQDSTIREFFKKYDDSYLFAIPLRIEQKCLSCHGEKSDAPSFISKNYQNAYDYNIGELRGILSISIPMASIESYFNQLFLADTIKNLFIFSVLLLFVLYLARKNKMFDVVLQNEVQKKTKELLGAQQKIQHMLEYDELTKLPNYQKLQSDLKGIEKANLAIINIDGFRNINDFYGTNYGDELLRLYGAQIEKLLQDEKVRVYKMHSDEFAMLDTFHTHEEFYALMAIIIEKLDHTRLFVIDQEIIVAASVGICYDVDAQISKANIALKKAKQDNKTISIYAHDTKQQDRIKNHLKMLQVIKEAIKDDRILIYLQPIYDLDTMQVLKHEVLVRLQEKDGNILTPYHFLDIAKSAKLYPQITKIVIQKALELHIKNPHTPLSINISSLDIDNLTTVKFIIKAIKNHPHPQNITFEILESDKIDNYVLIRSFIKRLKDFGCKFAIDDFGSGYSNFAHIIDLDVDFLKIDASLIKHIDTDKTSTEVVAAIKLFSDSLDIAIIAEFVENENILNKIKQMGLRYGQGYLLGKPSEKVGAN